MSIRSNEVTKNKVTYKIQGMDCDSCAKMIELDLEDAGINCKCSFAKKTLEVDADEEEHKKVREIVEKSGYKII